MATNDKYDRQLRLWGASGQKSLSESCVILINATAVGTETLKNLILPGIGSFHIIDDQIVQPSFEGGGEKVDPFSNFFVFNHAQEKEIIEPKSRAQVAAKNLGELNSDVNGSYTSVPSLKSADFASLFSSIRNDNPGKILVIAADVPPTILSSIASICWQNDSQNINNEIIRSQIPLVIVKSYGLIGTVRVQIVRHPVIESKPKNTKPDLRLMLSEKIFPELHDFASRTASSKAMDNKAHGHIPFVTILLTAMSKWRSANKKEENELPKSSLEKNDFKEVIKSMSRDLNNELNFLEACNNDYLAYTYKEVPWETQELLANSEQLLRTKIENNLHKDITTFDILLLALNKFLEINNDQPPVDGSIPDMTSSTKTFIELQKIYKLKSDNDKNKMQTIIEQIRKDYTCYKSFSVLLPSISEEELGTFCKNVFNLQLVQTRSYSQEYAMVYTNEEEKLSIQGDIINATFDPYEVADHTPMLWYIALRACDTFYEDFGYYPGRQESILTLKNDEDAVQNYIERIVAKMDLMENDLINLTLLSKDEERKGMYAKEMVRYHNAEVHNVASIIGGVASQEAVKLITNQYVPIDGTYVFNGIACVAAVYKF